MHATPSLGVPQNPIACKNCRRRGRKCDRRLPTCVACEQRAQTCEGYPSRWTGVAARGRLVGKDRPTLDSSQAQAVFHEAPKSLRHSGTLRWRDMDPTKTAKRRTSNKRRTPKRRESSSLPPTDTGTIIVCSQLAREPRPPTTPPPSIAVNQNEAWEDGQVQDEDGSPLVEDESLHGVSGQAASPIDDYFGNADGLPCELLDLLDYYRREVSPMFSLNMASTDNPFLSHILPLAHRTPSLLYAVAALASCHRFVRVRHVDVQLKCLYLRGKGLRLLRERLDRPELVREPGTLETLLMLTHLDVCYTGVSKFEIYFQGAKQLLQLTSPDSTSRGFIEQQFLWLDMMGSTTALRDPVFSEVYATNLDGRPCDQERRWGYEDLFSCPIDQFDMICRVTMLYKSRTGTITGTTTGTATLDAAYIYQAVLRAWKAPGHLTGPDLHLAEAFRSAILLYLYRLFPVRRPPGEIGALLDSIMLQADAIPRATGWSFQLLWPLFQAGLEVDGRDVASQAWFRDRLNHMTSGVAFRNNETALALLEGVWAADLHPDYTAVVAGSEAGDIMLV